jgi:hypothetical protein
MSNPNEPTQSEKREVLRDSYLSRAVADADLSAQGRFKRETATHVTGVPSYPQLPDSSPWSNDPVPPEEQLGFSVDELPSNLGGASSSVAPAFAPSAVEPDDVPPFFQEPVV